MAQVERVVVVCDRCKREMDETGQKDASVTFTVGKQSTEFSDLCRVCLGIVRRGYNDFARAEVFPPEELNQRKGKEKKASKEKPAVAAAKKGGTTETATDKAPGPGDEAFSF